MSKKSTMSKSITQKSESTAVGGNGRPNVAVSWTASGWSTELDGLDKQKVGALARDLPECPSQLQRESEVAYPPI